MPVVSPMDHSAYRVPKNIHPKHPAGTESYAPPLLETSYPQQMEFLPT